MRKRSYRAIGGARGVPKAEEQFYRQWEERRREKAAKKSAAPTDPGIQQDNIRDRALKAMSAMHSGAARSPLSSNEH